MANGVRINNLNKATSLNDTDTITIIQDDENKKASISLFDKDGTYTQSVVNTIPNLITTSKANVETTKQAIDEKFGHDEFSVQIVTSQAMSSVGVGDDGSVDVSAQVQDGFMESATLYGKTQYHDTTADVYYDSMPEDTTGMTLELVSVKMPTLHTVGKNLIDYKSYNLKANGQQNPQEIIVDEQGLSFNVDSVGWKSLWYDLYLESGEKYTLSYDTNLLKCFIFKSKVNTYVDSELVVSATVTDATEDKIQKVTKTFTAPSTGFIRIRLTSEQKVGNHILRNFQIEKGSTTTTYEPHKSSILSCNEEIILRGIGDVKDELNLLTGELTKRIVEIVLDGSENWSVIANFSNGDCKAYSLTINDYTSNIVCDGLKILPNDLKFGTKEGVFVNNNLLVVKKNIATIELFKQWLSQNPLTVQYRLETESIKTVDLNSSNGDVKTPVTYKNGHVLLQSDGLIPELHYSIPVSYSGLIAQNTMTNLKHSWRLDELEIMAYTSIVNSQYESLILVATAETNEVVVSSEYVPDESLYNMLKVLVNANALENADEKINVFYLYGKLSDEMYIDLIMGDDM